jgi:hypothetical protein
MSFQIAACPNHPQREAIGVCVRCRCRVCSECATKVDGINYCVGCLAALAGQASARTPRWSGFGRARMSLAYVSAGTYFVVLSALVWTLLQVLLPAVPR